MVWPFTKKKPQLRTLEEIKALCRVLFIDDDPEFPIFEILKQEGWRVHDKRDITSFEDGDLQLAHVVFVDIHGVGRAMSFAGEGLGLARAIKERSPEKLVTIYSAQRKGDRFAPELTLVDHRIAKDAEPYEFIQTLEKLAKSAFDPNLCVQRAVSFVLQSGVPLERQELDKRIHKLLGRRSWDPDEIAKALSTTAKVAHTVVSILGNLSK